MFKGPFIYVAFVFASISKFIHILRLQLFQNFFLYSFLERSMYTRSTTYLHCWGNSLINILHILEKKYEEMSFKWGPAKGLASNFPLLDQPIPNAKLGLLYISANNSSELPRQNLPNCSDPTTQ